MHLQSLLTVRLKAKRKVRPGAPYWFIKRDNTTLWFKILITFPRILTEKLRFKVPHRLCYWLASLSSREIAFSAIALSYCGAIWGLVGPCDWLNLLILIKFYCIKFAHLILGPTLNCGRVDLQAQERAFTFARADFGLWVKGWEHWEQVSWGEMAICVKNLKFGLFWGPVFRFNVKVGFWQTFYTNFMVKVILCGINLA